MNAPLYDSIGPKGWNPTLGMIMPKPAHLCSRSDTRSASYKYPSWRKLAMATAAMSLLGLSACSKGILDPQGPIAEANKTILIDSIAIMLAIVIPTMIATVGFAWWYRASNTRATYRPDFAHSGAVELVVWSIPILVILLLGGVAWIGSHDLDPAKPIESTEQPLDIQVVALDWKWLFIYPDGHVATVNELTVPVNVPLRMSLTSSSVMNVFFVPQLGTMIYAMSGMQSPLNLMASSEGTFHGLGAHYSGAGFSDMSFKVNAVSKEQFQAWLAKAQTAPERLDRAAYEELARQSSPVAPKTFTLADPGLFDAIVRHKIPPGPGPQPESASSTPSVSSSNGG